MADKNSKIEVVVSVNGKKTYPLGGIYPDIPEYVPTWADVINDLETQDAEFEIISSKLNEEK